MCQPTEEGRGERGGQCGRGGEPKLETERIGGGCERERRGRKKEERQERGIWERRK